MHWVGFIIIQAIVVAAIFMGGDLMKFINAPSFIFTFGCAHAAMWMAHGKDSVAILGSSFADTRAAEGILMAQTARRSYVIAGWLGVFVGAIQMAHGLEDMGNFAPAFGVLILCPFYGHLMDLCVWMPLERFMVVQAQEKSAAGQ